jgi:hypothetical protein
MGLELVWTVKMLRAQIIVDGLIALVFIDLEPGLHVKGVHATLCKLGAVAQLGARLNGIQKVKGSNPFSSTSRKPRL